MPLLQIVQRLRVRLKLDSFGKLEIKDQNIQPSLGRNGRIQLTQAARRSVARIGKKALSGFLTGGIQFFKHLPRHKHLSAHDQSGRCIINTQGNGTDGLEILRHIFPNAAVAAGRAADKHTVPILQCDGQAIHLRLHAVGRVPHRLAQAAVKLFYLFLGKNILQALQRDGMLHLFKAAQCLPADAFCRRQGRGELRILRLQLLQPAKLFVIFIVLHGRGVQHVIKPVCLLQFPSQFFDFLLWIHGSSSKPM